METTIDLFSLSDQGLADLHGSVFAEMTAREAKRRENAIAAILALATEAGLDLNCLPQQIEKPVRRTVVEPKYRNRACPEQTWSGRGKRPKWLKTMLNDGYILEDFRI